LLSSLPLFLINAANAPGWCRGKLFLPHVCVPNIPKLKTSTGGTNEV
jgi:hypothetical protein